MCVTLPTTCNAPLIVVLANVAKPATSMLLSKVTLLLGTIISPVPFALNSKLLLLCVVVIKLSSIKISPVLNLFAVIVPELLMSFTVSVPATIKSFETSKSLFGIRTLPVPTARNSKSALLVVVVIKLSSTNISSNCAAPVTSKSCVIVTLPVILLSPV